MLYALLVALSYLFVGIQYTKRRFKNNGVMKREDIVGYTVFWIVFWWAEDLRQWYIKYWETEVNNPFRR